MGGQSIPSKKPPEQRRKEMGGRLGLAGSEQAGRNGLKGIGDAKGVLGGDPSVRIEAAEDIGFPKIRRLLEQLGHRGGGGALGRPGWQFLAIAGAAAC